MNIQRLRVNHLENPLGFSLGEPVFSWEVTDTISQKQTQAQIRVFQGEQCVLDTGPSPELDSLGTRLPLKTLPRTRYSWRVTVWGDRGDVGESETVWFETGKQDEPWQGGWIRGGEKENGILERAFVLSAAVKRARIYISGLGLYRLFLNGLSASGEVLTPGLNAYDRWVQVQTFDVGDLLHPGENRLEIWLGGGISRGRFSYTPTEGYTYCPYDCAVAELRILTEEREIVLSTDESWTWRSSPILESSIYNGETWDYGAPVRRETARRCAPPVGPLRDRLSPPVKILRERKPLALLRTPKGETVLDMGQNMVGWLRFPVSGPKGSVRKLQFGEQLEDGCFSRANLRTAEAAFTWVCDGKARSAEPFFTWYGFRYVLLEGFPEDVRAEEFTGCVVSSELEETGSLVTGHSLLNRLLENARWSQWGNFLDVPTDCPQRDEREGWTGDAQVFADTACFHRDCAAFYTKYMADMLEEQRKAGGCVPYVVPFARRRFEGGAVGWADAATVIPWTLWLHYGDNALLERMLPNMLLWVRWVAAQENWAEACRHFGDWLALDRPEEPKERVGKTDVAFLCLCYAFYSASLTAKAAAILGDTASEGYCTALAEEYRHRLRKNWFTPVGDIRCRTQTACVIALHLGLAPAPDRLRETLTSLVQETGHLTTGFLGTPWLLEELPEAWAWKLLLREEYPSWLYEVRLGATTIWERWNSLTPEGRFSETGMNSLNHYAYGSVAAWAYRRIGGIAPLEEGAGFRVFRWEPLPNPALGHALCRLRTPCGEIVSAWEYGPSELRLRLRVPFGSEAEICLPDGRQERRPAGEYSYVIPRSGEETESGEESQE